MEHTGRRTRRAFMGLAAAGLSVPVITACGGGSSSGGGKPKAPTSAPIDIMGFTTSDEVGTSRVAYAKRQAPKLDVKVAQNGFDQQKFATAMGGGTPPAGVYLDRQFIATYAAKDFLVPLDDYISSLNIDMKQYYDEAVKEASYKGKVYGLPDFYTTRAIYADNRVLKAAGLTIDDIDTSNWSALTTVAKKMYRSAKGKPTVIGYDPKLPEYLPLWAMANGGSIVDSDGKPTLDDSKVVDALSYTVDLVNAQGRWGDFKSFRDTWDFFGAGNEFVKEQIGAMDYEQFYVAVLADFESKLDLSATQFKGKDGKPLTFESGTAFCITKNSPNAGGMAQFMKLATSQPAWAEAAKARQAVVVKNKSTYSGIFSANKPSNDTARAKYIKHTSNSQFDKVISVFNDTLDTAKRIPVSPAGQEIQSAYQQAASEALQGKNPKSALAGAQSRAVQAYRDATG